MGLGTIMMEFLSEPLQKIGAFAPGDVFPHLFVTGNGPGIFQYALVSSIIVTFVAGVLGSFLLMRNLSLIGDGLAHVSFGGICVGLVLGYADPMGYALAFSVIAAILIFEMQRTGVLTGDASIAIFLTGMLAFGLVVLRRFGGGIQNDVEGYLFGNLLLIDSASLDLIVTISIISTLSIFSLHRGLLATSIDPVSAEIQGIPSRQIGLFFSVITAMVVVSMVKIVGALLVTALLVTPAATAQQVGKSFRSCLIWAQIFGHTAVFIGLYLSFEYNTGSGSMIAVVSASIFGIVVIGRGIMTRVMPEIN